MVAPTLKTSEANYALLERFVNKCRGDLGLRVALYVVAASEPDPGVVDHDGPGGFELPTGEFTDSVSVVDNAIGNLSEGSRFDLDWVIAAGESLRFLVRLAHAVHDEDAIPRGEIPTEAFLSELLGDDPIVPAQRRAA